MAIRNVTHILKNSNINNQPLPISLQGGEPIVNTADGIMYFSGNSIGSQNWVGAGPIPPANGFFEVGSNLNQLQIRDKITSYSGVSGLALVNKILIGTTAGFQLANINEVGVADIYVTSGTYNSNTGTITFYQNSGGTFDVTGIYDTFVTGGTYNPVSGTATFRNNTGGTFNVTGFTLSANTEVFVTGGTYNQGNGTATFRNNTGGTFNVTGFSQIYFDTVITGGTYNQGNGTTTYTNNSGGTFSITGFSQVYFDTFVTGGTYNNNTGTATYINNTGGTFTVSGFFTGSTEVFVTGGTYNQSTGIATYTNNTGGTFTVTGFSQVYFDTYVTGGTFSNGTITYTNNTGGTFTVTGLTATDTFVTGFTYNPSTNTFTISQNQGQVDRTATINSVTGLTVGSGGITSSGSIVANGGIVSNGNVTVNGNLTVIGTAISAFTTDLYIKDNNISLNYNPIVNTISTSIGAGWTIQDGNGIAGGNVNLQITPLNTLSGLTSGQTPSIIEYSGPDGYSNRGFVTQLNDIIIRSTNLSLPNGVRLIAEFDVIDGGTF